MSQNKCRYHPDGQIVEDYRAGDMICTECGLVIADRVIDVRCEWRSPDKCRVGDVENQFMYDMTTITSGGAYGHLANATDRALVGGYNHIETVAVRIEIPSSISDR